MIDVKKMFDRAFGVPSAKQREFFLKRERYVAYGGARGGGKSWAARYIAALYCLRYPGLRALIVRRTLHEVRENHIAPLLKAFASFPAYIRPDYAESKGFVFQNGSVLRAGYLDGDADCAQYQGQEFDIIVADEATHFTFGQFLALTVCLRGANRYPKRMFLTCNPGGVGHAWVKRLFIDRDFKEGEDGADHAFVRALIFDNEALMKSDGAYLSALKRLPQKMRDAWLYGRFEVFSGQYFAEWSEEMTEKPFVIPPEWRRSVSIDYGLDMFAALFFAESPDGIYYCYREVTGNDLIISHAAKRLQCAAEGEDLSEYLAPADLFSRRQESGVSAADIFLQNGVPLLKAQNERVFGWLSLKEYLNSGRLKIFSHLTELISCLTQLTCDEKNPTDVSRFPHELTHLPDALRYWCAHRRAVCVSAAVKPAVWPYFEKDGTDFERFLRY